MRETTLWVLSQWTPFHLQGVGSEEFHVDATYGGSLRLLERERRCSPSGDKDETSVMERVEKRRRRRKEVVIVSVWISYLWSCLSATVVVFGGVK